MAPTLVQTKASGTAASGTSLAATLNSGTTAGNLVIAYLQTGKNTGGGAPTVSLPSGWAVAQEFSSSTTMRAGIYYLANCGGGLTSFTFTTSVSAETEVILEEWSGCATTTPLDVTTASSTTTVTVSTGTTVGSATAGDLAVFLVSYNNTTSKTYSGVTAGYTASSLNTALSPGGAPNVNVAAWNRVLSSGGTQTAGLTLSAIPAGGGGNTEAILATFLAAIAGTPVTHATAAKATLALAHTPAVAGTATVALVGSHAVTSAATLALANSRSLTAQATLALAHTSAVASAAPLALARSHTQTSQASLARAATHATAAQASLALARTPAAFSLATLALLRTHALSTRGTLACVRTHGAQASAVLIQPPYGVTHGINTQTYPVPTNAYLPQQIVTWAQGMGLSVFRFQIDAALIWRTQSDPWQNWSWAPLDDAISKILTAGIRPVYPLRGMPSWGLANSNYLSTTEPWYLPDPAVVQTFAQGVLSRYNGVFNIPTYGPMRLAGIELGNEEYNIHFDNPSTTVSSQPAPALSTVAQASTFSAATYKAAYTLVFTIGGSNFEGLPSPTTTSATMSGTTAIQVDALAGLPAGCTAVNYYVATTGGGSTLGFVTSTTVASGAVGATVLTAPGNGTQPPSVIKAVRTSPTNPALYGSAGQAVTGGTVQPSRDPYYQQQVLTTLLPGLRSYTPSGTMIGSGAAWWFDDRNYYSWFFGLGASALALVDYANFHYYSGANDPLVPSGHRPSIQTAIYAIQRGLRDAGVPNLPLVCSEFGSSSADFTDTQIAANYAKVLEVMRGFPLLGAWFFTLDSATNPSPDTLIRWNSGTGVYDFLPGYYTYTTEMAEYPVWLTGVRGTQASASLALLSAHAVAAKATLTTAGGLVSTHPASAAASLALLRSHPVATKASVTVLRSHPLAAQASAARAASHGVTTQASLALLRSHSVATQASVSLLHSHPAAMQATLALLRSHPVAAQAGVAVLHSHPLATKASVTVLRSHPLAAQAPLLFIRTHGITASASITSAHQRAVAPAATLALLRSHAATARTTVARLSAHTVAAQVPLQVAQAIAVRQAVIAAGGGTATLAASGSGASVAVTPAPSARALGPGSPSVAQGPGSPRNAVLPGPWG